MNAVVQIDDDFYRLDGWTRYQPVTNDAGAVVGFDVWFPAGNKGERRAELRGHDAAVFESALGGPLVLHGTPAPGLVISVPSPFDQGRPGT